MTQSSASPTEDAALVKPESFMAVVYRRTRYSLAVLVSAVVFCTFGWQLISPPADWGGVSLVAWQNHGYFSAVFLTVILLAVTGICALIVHPDSPHAGLMCSLLGMFSLSIRGGTVHLLVVHEQAAENLKGFAYSMALECLIWGMVALLADYFARILHDRLLTNTHWIQRSNPNLGKGVMNRTGLRNAVGVSHAVSTGLGTAKIKGPVRIPLAIVWSGGIAYLLLYALMQSEMKGQVIMACFTSFLVSTMCAYMAFPTVPFWAILIAVPLTAAAGYVVGANYLPTYPGHASYFAMRALPIDYLTAGAPGAILGYYWALAWSIGSVEE